MLLAAPPKTKKVLIIVHNHPHFFPGGAEIFAYDLFKAIRTYTEYKPFFLAAADPHKREVHTGTPFQTLSDAADEALFWGGSFDYFYQSQQVPSFMYVDFKNFLLDLQPDVIHLHHTIRFGVEAIQIARQVLPDVKIVLTLHEFILICNRDGQMVRKDNEQLCEAASPDSCAQCFPDYAPQQFKMREEFIKAHLDLVDCFISPSHFLAQRFVDWGLPEAKITVMENGRQIHPAAPHRQLASGEKRDRFGFFGQINPYKGVLLILEAVEYLVEHNFTNFHLDLFGNVATGFPEFEAEFDNFLDKYQSIVTHHGRYKQAEIPDLIQLVDWVVVPSVWWENSPLVIQEVFMHKRPVICSNIGGMAEKVEDNVTGLHFKVRDKVSLANKIEHTSKDFALWQQLVDNIEPRLSIEASAKQHAQVYESI